MKIRAYLMIIKTILNSTEYNKEEEENKTVDFDNHFHLNYFDKSEEDNQINSLDNIVTSEVDKIEHNEEQERNIMNKKIKKRILLILTLKIMTKLNDNIIKYLF